MKKKNFFLRVWSLGFTSMLLVFLLLGQSAKAQVIWQETFSKITINDFKIGGGSTLLNGNLSDFAKLCDDNHAWLTDTNKSQAVNLGKVLYIYQTKGVKVALQNSGVAQPDCESLFIETPAIDLSGNGGTFNLNFTAMSSSSNGTTRLKVYLINGASKTLIGDIRDLQNTAGSTGKQYVLLNVTGGTANSKIRFENGFKLVPGATVGTDAYIADTNDFATPKTRTSPGFYLDEVILSAGNADASLSAISYGGTAVPGFNANTFDYLLKLPNTTSAIPALTCTTTAAGATVAIFNDTVWPAKSTIKVTSPNGVITKVYTVDLRRLAPASRTGSRTNPYTVADAFAYVGDSVWVTGRLVSSVSSSGLAAIGSSTALTVALTDVPFTKDSSLSKVPTPYFGVALPSGPIRTNTTLQFNVDRTGRTIKYLGKISDNAVDGCRSGMSVPTAYAFTDDCSLDSLKFNGTMWKMFVQDSLSKSDPRAEMNVSYGYLPSMTVVPTITWHTTNNAVLVNYTPAATFQDTAKIKVTAEDGVTVRTYKISFRPANNNANITSLSVKSTTAPAANYGIKETFSPTTYNYTLDTIVRWKNANAIVLTYTVADRYAVTTTTSTTFNVQRAATLTADYDTSVVLTITAEDNITKANYKVNFRVKAANTNGNLANINVQTGSLITTPIIAVLNNPIPYRTNADTIDYNIPYTGAALKPYIRPYTEDAYATVSSFTQVGSANLVVGSKYVNKVIVTRENNTKDSVIIRGTYLPNDTAFLDTIMLVGATLQQSFVANVFNYIADATAPSTDFVTISAPTMDPDAKDSVWAATNPSAKFDSTGRFPLAFGDNVFFIKVNAQLADSTKLYTVTVKRPFNTDATLNAIAITKPTGEAIAYGPDFKPSRHDYYVVEENTLPFAVDSVVIEGTPSDNNATVTNPVNTRLAVGRNDFTINVTAQDGTTVSSYTVQIMRAAGDSVATLDSLLVNGAQIASFDKNTLAYTYVYAHGTTSIDLKGVATSDLATVNGNGTITNFSTPATITVTAQDVTKTKTYTVTFREESADATLSGIKVGGIDLVGFASATLNYTDTVPAAATTVPVVTATATSQYANVVVTPATTFADTTKIVVTAEDGTTLTYKVAFVKSASSNALLSALTVDGTPVAGFSPTTVIYNVNVTGKTSITIGATAQSAGATIAGLGAHDITMDTTEFDVLVTAEDGTTTEKYTIRTIKSGIDNINGVKVAISLIPNPATDVVTVKLTGINGQAQANVYNTVGTLVLSQEINGESTLNVSNLAKGSYFVKVTTKQGTFVEKLIKY